MKYHLLVALVVLSGAAIAQDTTGPEPVKEKNYFKHAADSVAAASDSLASASLAIESLEPQITALQTLAARNQRRVDLLEKYHDELIKEMRNDIDKLKRRIAELESD